MRKSIEEIQIGYGDDMLMIDDFPEPVAPIIPSVFHSFTEKLMSDKICFPSSLKET